MKIPVFVSWPTVLTDTQERVKAIILQKLGELQLEPRALGKSDYLTDLPIREVYSLETHFSGEIILDFCKDRVIKFLAWEKTGEDFALPTSWKQLEEEILFELQKRCLFLESKAFLVRYLIMVQETHS